MGILSSLFGGEKVHPTPVRSMDRFREEVLTSDIPVIVDLWSPTCAPCKRLVPVLVKVATKYADRVRVVEIDVSTTEPQLLGKLGVRATPTLMIYEGGDEVGRVTGFKSPGWFDQMIATEFPDA